MFMRRRGGIGRPSPLGLLPSSRLELPFQTRSSKHHQPSLLPSTRSPRFPPNFIHADKLAPSTTSQRVSDYLRVSKEPSISQDVFRSLVRFAVAPMLDCFQPALRVDKLHIAWSHHNFLFPVQSRYEDTLTDMRVPIVPYMRYATPIPPSMTHAMRLNELLRRCPTQREQD